MGPVRSPLQYLDHEHTFTPSMSKRTGQGPFAAAPMIQGAWDGIAGIDALSFARGDQISGVFYENYDASQGSIVFWITPEWSGGDGRSHWVYRNRGTNNDIQKMSNNNLRARTSSGLSLSVDVSGWTAGTTYQLVWRWDTQNTIDGSTQAALSIDDVHTYGSTAGGVSLGTVIDIGQDNSNDEAVDAIIEGLTIYRRVLYDGEFGVDANGIDEIAAIHAAGVGADPTLITGSWDVVFCCPTNSAVGALVTGAGEAWSHPHSSNVPHQFFMADGYHGGNHNAVEYNGTTTSVVVGDVVALQNLADAEFTAEAWIKAEGLGEGGEGRIFDKTDNLVEGWRFFVAAGGLVARIHTAGTFANSAIGADEFAADGKWHHVVMYFNDAGDRKIYIAVDGRWALSYDSQVAAVGAVIGDIGNDLYIGNTIGSGSTFDGAIAWARFSDNDRHAHGTDFIAPRLFPAADGNTIEAWSFDDGTGANIVAQVASPGNDGTAANHVWITPWAEEGTPLSVQGIEFDGAATSVRIPDAAALQDLHDAAFTVEAWVRADSWGELNFGRIFVKTASVMEGWRFYVHSLHGLAFVVFAATDLGIAYAALSDLLDDSKLHHVVAQYDDGGDRKGYLWVDGIPVSSYDSQNAAVGAVISDIGNDLYLGNRSNGDTTWDGLLGGWCRISNILRYVNGEAFLPPAPTNAPALPDVNTVWQTDYSDGAGGTLTDDSATGSDGVITIGAGRWWNTRDANLNDAGEMPFGAGGYMFGTDAANEGIEQTWAGLTPGENYVVRAVVFPTADGNFYPQIAIRDETNGANIVLFDGPRYVGAHTGANNSATLINAGARWPQSLVGATVYNITDGSFADITAISGDGTIITAALGGGTDDDWDTGDIHRIVWAVATDPINDGYWRHPWIETFTFELPTMARNGVGADCVSISARILNVNNDGTLVCAQLELLENLIDNPSLEAVYAGVPPIPPGWTNVNLDAGDTQASSGGGAIIHSGAEATQWNVGAVDGEWIFSGPLGMAAAGFYSIGYWGYGDAAIGILLQEANDEDAALQAQLAGSILPPPVAVAWAPSMGIWRGLGGAAGARVSIQAVTGAGAARYTDDAYLFLCDPVTLTITPASEVNSAESGGIRVDGYDSLTQPVLNRLKARSGHIIWRGRLRHVPANLVAFWEGAEVTLLDAFGAAANYARVRATVLNTVDTRFDDGGGAQTVNWAAAGAWAANDELFLELYWRGHFMQLSVAGIPVATINQPVDFAVLPTILYWGLLNSGGTNIDTVIKEP